MPYVQVKVAGALSKDQKTKISERIATALEEIAAKPKNVTYIVFEEVASENWAVGDKLLSDS